MDNSTTSGSVEELKEECNLIIYIVGLILLIIWKVIVMCQVRLHWKHKRLEKLVESQRLYKQNTTPFFSHSSSNMGNVFGESVGNGPVDLQIVKKVVVTKGQYKDCANEIRQSYELGFPPYRLHTNVAGTFVTPIRVYDGG